MHFWILTRTRLLYSMANHQIIISRNCSIFRLSCAFVNICISQSLKPLIPTLCISHLCHDAFPYYLFFSFHISDSHSLISNMACRICCTLEYFRMNMSQQITRCQILNLIKSLVCETPRGKKRANKIKCAYINCKTD